MRIKATKCRFDTARHFGSASGIANGQISHSKAPRIAQKVVGNTKVAGKRKKRTAAKITMKSEVSQGRVVVDLPLQTKSEANCFEPWQVKHGRHREQQRIVALGFNSVRDKIQLPCSIKLTRFAPNKLDVFDNLPMSLKYIVDAVCAIITGEKRAGKADSDERLTISCDQVKSDAYGVRVEITY